MGDNTLPLSKLVSTNAEARTAAAFISAALQEFLSDTLSVNVNNYIDTVQTAIGVDEIVNIITNPWDVKVIKNVKRKSDDGTSWLPLIIINSLEEVENYKLQTFTENKPQLVYVEQSSLKILPVPTAVYDLQIYYTAAVPRVTVDDLTNITTLDAEGDYVLSLFVEALYREKQGDPLYVNKLTKAEEKKIEYRERNNRLSKRHNKAGSLNMWFNSGDYIV